MNLAVLLVEGSDLAQAARLGIFAFLPQDGCASDWV